MSRAHSTRHVDDAQSLRVVVRKSRPCKPQSTLFFPQPPQFALNERTECRRCDFLPRSTSTTRPLSTMAETAEAHIS